MGNSTLKFGKQILIPFASGVIGAGVVLGAYSGVNIFKNIASNNNETYIEEKSSSRDNNLISLSEYSDTAIYAANKILPSVVGIKVEYSVSSVFYRNSSTATAEGSGVIISEDGYIITNNHVIDNSSSSSYYQVSEANKVTVTLYNDDTEYEGTIIGTDEQTDIAVIKIDKTGLTAAEIGDSESLQVGEFVMAVGNPLSLTSSVSSGIVSATNRKVTNDGKTYTLIQTDSAINSGNSGGALVNSKGQLVGINTLKMSGSGVEGLGFAIPINSAKTISDQLIQYNKVKRPYIGISGRDIDEQMAKTYNLVVGEYIVNVHEFSPAEKAGLKAGDVIIEIDGKKITNMDDINEVKSNHQIGDEITIKINRNGEEKEFKLTLEEQ